MQAEEKQLIDGLFDRLRQAEEQTGPRHAEAEAVIQDAVRRQPAAPYYMTQAILIQEHALEQLNQRVQELEEELSRRPQQASSGSFLGGLFGAGKTEPAAAAPAVPQRRFQPPPGVTVGGQPAPNAMAAGAATPGAQPAQGGSFMGSAMQTAVAVAGGLVIGSLLANMLFGDDGADALAEGADTLADASSAVEYDDIPDTSLPEDDGGGFADMDFGDFED